MIEASYWHPVADAAALADAPLAATLLGHDLALWRDGAGAVMAFTDRCPHRGTKLSMGRVCEGRLECAYHGWRFASDGACVTVPALPQFVPPASHRATVHAATVAQGLVWVRLADRGDAAPPPFEAEGDPRLRKLLVGPYDVAASAPRIVENFLDMAHFGFVHDGVLGDRAHVALAEYRIEATANGFVAGGCKAWQPRANRLSSQGSEVSYRYELTAPYSATLTKLPQAQDGYFDVIALFICPMEQERSRVWFRMAVTDFHSSDADLRAFQHGIFLQDQPVLESQHPKRLPLHGEVHSAADRSSAAYRRFLRERGITFGVC